MKAFVRLFTGSCLLALAGVAVAAQPSTGTTVAVHDAVSHKFAPAVMVLYQTPKLVPVEVVAGINTAALLKAVRLSIVATPVTTQELLVNATVTRGEHA